MVLLSWVTTMRPIVPPTSQPGTNEIHVPACGVPGLPRLATLTSSNHAARRRTLIARAHRAMIPGRCDLNAARRVEAAGAPNPMAKYVTEQEDGEFYLVVLCAVLHDRRFAPRMARDPGDRAA